MATAVQLTRGNSISLVNVQIEVVFLHSTLLVVSVIRSFAHLLGWDDEIHVRRTAVNIVPPCTSPTNAVISGDLLVRGIKWFMDYIATLKCKNPISVSKYGC